MGGLLITREFDDIPVDEGICDDQNKLCWLHFADCVNNGGTSQLFIDFSPSAKGINDSYDFIYGFHKESYIRESEAGRFSDN